MLTNKFYEKPRIVNVITTPWVLLLLLTFIVHGLVLINKGVFWDGVLIYAFQKNNNIAFFHKWFLNMGNPLSYYLHRLLWLTNSQFVYNAIGFFSIYCTGLFSYKIASLYKSIPKMTALLIGVIAITFPGSMLTFFRATIPYYVFMTLFMLACYCGLTAPNSKNEITQITLRIISLVLFFASFTLQSLLVYFTIFIICLYILFCEKNKHDLISFASIYKFCAKYFYFLALPFVFKILTTIFFKKAGSYKDYNTIAINNLKHFFAWYNQSLHEGIFFYFKTIFHLRALIFIIVVSLILMIWRRMHPKHHLNTKPFLLKTHLLLIALGIIAVLLAILPYVLVGKPIKTQSWVLSSRCALLIPLSISLIIAGIVGLAIRYKNTKTIAILFTIVLLFTFAQKWWHNYLLLSTKSAAQQAAIRFVNTHPQFAKYRICWLNQMKLPSILNPGYGIYDWSTMWNNYQAKNSKIVMTTLSRDNLAWVCLKNNQRISNYADVNLNGPQADLILSSKYTDKNLIKLNLQYIYYRFFNRKKLNVFLKNIIDIQVIPTRNKINVPLICENYMHKTHQK